MKNLATIALLAIAATCLPAWTFASNQEVAEQIGNRLRESGRLHDFRIKILFKTVRRRSAGAWVVRRKLIRRSKWPEECPESAGLSTN